MKKKIAVLILLAALLSPAFPVSKEPAGIPETIVHFRLEEKAVVFSVVSKGCTFKNSFRLETQKKDNLTELTLLRVTEDNCKAMPEVIEIRFTHDELKGRVDLNKPVRLMNPLSLNMWR